MVSLVDCGSRSHGNGFQNSAAVGSTYHWSGTVTGEGELVHKDLQPGRLIQDDLNFIKPFKSFAKTAFVLKPDRDGTQVTWNMDSSLPWFLFWMIPMMKTFIGMDYQRGLSMLKDLIETDRYLRKPSFTERRPSNRFAWPVSPGQHLSTRSALRWIKALQRPKRHFETWAYL